MPLRRSNEAFGSWPVDNILRTDIGPLEISALDDAGGSSAYCSTCILSGGKMYYVSYGSIPIVAIRGEWYDLSFS